MDCCATLFLLLFQFAFNFKPWFFLIPIAHSFFNLFDIFIDVEMWVCTFPRDSNLRLKPLLELVVLKYVIQYNSFSAKFSALQNSTMDISKFLYPYLLIELCKCGELCFHFY